jgi:type II pantothenate kinase
MLVDGPQVSRVGGTALGGGTVMGLGARLTGRRRFEEIAALAAAGDRRKVDLLVSDIYPAGDFVLPGYINAASFAKIASHPGEVSDADLAHGVMGLVGENVGLICCGLAVAAKADRIAWGGATLRDNPSLVAVLSAVCRAYGREPVFLRDGEFVGALGALDWAADSDMG